MGANADVGQLFVNTPDGSASRVSVTDIIDAAAVGAFQIRIIVVCLCVSMLDGFDTQSMAFVAPSISELWGVAPARFGVIFSATLLGTALGAVLLGRLADRYGRRKLIVAAVALFGLMTLACGWASDFTSLLLLRFVAGVGLGGAIPNFLAYASEYAPARARSTIVVFTLWGFPAGAVLGGLASAPLIRHSGWTAVFYVGGLLPLVLVPLLLTLPESIRYLTLQPSSGPSIAAILGQIDRTRPFAAEASYFLPEGPVQARRLRAVFENGLASGTLLLGGALCSSLLLSYLLVNWVPLLFRGLGLRMEDAVLGAVMLNAGGIAGSYLFSRLMDRSRHSLRVMAGSYVLAALAVGSIGLFGVTRGFLLASTGVVGFFLIGTQMALTAYTADYYPSAVRATGIGLTQALGRCGSLAGPLIGGGLLSTGVLPLSVFRLGVVPALVTAGLLMGLQVLGSRARISG
jgi:MFS transporter, AAHS family, 4-hydroxybenzoate transporter